MECWLQYFILALSVKTEIEICTAKSSNQRDLGRGICERESVILIGIDLGNRRDSAKVPICKLNGILMTMLI